MTRYRITFLAWQLCVSHTTRQYTHVQRPMSHRGHTSYRSTMVTVHDMLARRSKRQMLYARKSTRLCAKMPDGRPLVSSRKTSRSSCNCTGKRDKWKTHVCRVSRTNVSSVLHKQPQSRERHHKRMTPSTGATLCATARDAAAHPYSTRRSQRSSTPSTTHQILQHSSCRSPHCARPAPRARLKASAQD